MIEKITLDSIFLKKLGQAFSEVFDEKRVSETLEKNPFTIYQIYRLEEKIIGCINYTFLGDQMELIDLYVKEDFWGKKIGSKLIEVMLEEADKHSITSIFLEVNIDNQRAIALYKKYGFVVISKREGYYCGKDAWIMERKMG